MNKMKRTVALLLSLALVISVPSVGTQKGSKTGNKGIGTGIIRLMEFTEQSSVRLDN